MGPSNTLRHSTLTTKEYKRRQALVILSQVDKRPFGQLPFLVSR